MSLDDLVLHMLALMMLNLMTKILKLFMLNLWLGVIDINDARHVKKK